MRAAVIVAWTCLMLSGGVYAEDYMVKNGVGFFDTFMVQRTFMTKRDGSYLRWEVVLAPGELDRIKEACR